MQDVRLNLSAMELSAIADECAAAAVREIEQLLAQRPHPRLTPSERDCMRRSILAQIGLVIMRSADKTDGVGSF